MTCTGDKCYGGLICFKDGTSVFVPDYLFLLRIKIALKQIPNEHPVSHIWTIIVNRPKDNFYDVSIPESTKTYNCQDCEDVGWIYLKNGNVKMCKNPIHNLRSHL